MSVGKEIYQALNDCDIWSKPPLYLKTWLFLLLNTDGEETFITSIPDMQEQLSYTSGYRKIKPTRNELYKVLRWLKANEVIDCSRDVPKELLEVKKGNCFNVSTFRWNINAFSQHRNTFFTKVKDTFIFGVAPNACNFNESSQQRNTDDDFCEKVKEKEIKKKTKNEKTENKKKSLTKEELKNKELERLSISNNTLEKETEKEKAPVNARARDDQNEPVLQAKKFVKPTVQEVEEYVKLKGYHVDAEAFIAYYESNGWRVGKNPMKSWKGAVVTWEKRVPQNYKIPKEVNFIDIAQRMGG